MAKKTNRAEIADDKKDISIIESRIQLQKLEMKDKRWSSTLVIGAILPRAFYRYKITLELDERPYEERIKEIEEDMSGSLFKEEKVSKKKMLEQISSIRKELEMIKKECERIDFGAVVKEIKYKGIETTIVCIIPDDVIEPLNRQKYRLEAYKISLLPVFE
jgi:hypothetical protein